VVVLFLFVILLVTIGLPEGGCVVSICYIVDDQANLYLQSKNNTTTLWLTFISKVKTTQPPSGKPLSPK
jgi:hypothetical protein